MHLTSRVLKPLGDVKTLVMLKCELGASGYLNGK